MAQQAVSKCNTYLKNIKTIVPFHHIGYHTNKKVEKIPNSYDVKQI